MGTRLKILLAFMISFALMATVSLTLLGRSMNASYDAIEHRDLTANMGRVVQSIEASLQHLNTLTRDWSVWTEMYDHAAHPNPAWAKENIGYNAMEPADLSLVMIFGTQGRLISMTTHDKKGGTLQLPTLQASPYMALFQTDVHQPGCGLMKTDAGLMLTCWARITKSDSSGDFVGTLVAGRLLDASLTLKLREQTRLPFDVHASRILPQGLQPWSAMLSPPGFGSGDFSTSHDANTYHLYYRLQDLFHDNAGLITLDMPREVHIQGELLYRQVQQQLVWTALIMTILLAVAVHFLFVQRLRKFTSQLVKLTEETAWDRRIEINGSDELGILSGKVNMLLRMIESKINILKELTLTDTLTGLPNRRAFDARLALEFSRKQRNDRSLALLLLDVDYFKLYNDHYGHPAGDIALKEVASALGRSLFRTADFIARIGGEEFAILLPETDVDGARKMADRIRMRLQESSIPHADSCVAAHLTASIGIAIAGNETLDALVSRADRALYTAKRDGRDRACCDARETRLTASCLKAVSS